MASFIDNPVISGLGEQLGLSDMFSQMRGTAMVSDQNTTPVPHSKPNEPEYRNRPFIPPNMSARMGGVKPGVSGTNPIDPGMQTPGSLYTPQATALLGQYGVTPPTTAPDPNLFVHNPQAFQNHPVAAGLLERGMEGLAYAHPGANFLDSLIGGVRGMQEANAARSSQVNAQLMAPFQQAEQIGQLQHMSDQHTEALDTLNQHKQMLLESQAKLKQQQAELSERLSATPVKGEDGTMLIRQQQPDGTLKLVPAPELGVDGEQYAKNQYYANGMSKLVMDHGSRENIPQADLLKLVSGYTSAYSNAKSAAQITIQNMKDATADRNADVRESGQNARSGGKPGAGGQMVPADRMAYNSAEKRQAEIRIEGDRLSKIDGAEIDPVSGKIMTPNMRVQALRNLKNEHDQLEAQKQGILNKYRPGSNPPAAPTTLPISNGNPFGK